MARILTDKVKRWLIIFGYVAVLSWIIPAVSYNVGQMLEQHRIFRALRVIRAGEDPAGIAQAKQLLTDFGLEGIVYVIQALKQEDFWDQRMRLAKGLRRLLTCDEGRLRFYERRELRKLCEKWAGRHGKAAAEFDRKALLAALSTTRGELSPEARELVMDFAVEFWLVNRWSREDERDFLADEAQILKFIAFRNDDEIEFTGDESIRGEDALASWLKEQRAAESDASSENADLIGRLQRFLSGDPVRFSAEEISAMADEIEAWHTAMRSAGTLDENALKKKVELVLDGAVIPFPESYTDALCERIMAFKDDYISYSLTVKFRKYLDDQQFKWEEKGRKTVSFTPAEKADLLRIVRRCERDYSHARVKLVQLAASIVEKLVRERHRFTMHVSDVPREGSKLYQLKRIWKAKNDEIVIMDFVDLLQSPDFGVRVFASDALVTAGDFATKYVAKALAKTRVSPHTVVATREQTKTEREAILNAQNEQCRRECAWILGRIGTPEAIRALRDFVKDPNVGQTVVNVLTTLVEDKEKQGT